MSEASNQHRWQGQELYNTGKLTEALAEWQIASALDPENAHTHLWIGCCLRTEADKTQDQAGWEAAIVAFQRAIEIDPVNSYTHHALSGMYWRLKRKREAVSELRTAVSLDPNNIEAQFALGISQARIGDFRGSIQTTRALIALSNTEELQQLLADPDRTRERYQFLLSLGAGLAAVLTGVWIWRRRRG